jgi:chorismate-pyruvate lyase
LFSNPLIYRSPFEYAHLKSSDWLYQAAAQALRQSSFPYNLPATLLARRAVFQHEKHANSRMMVTEVMLPSVFLLTRKPEF